MLKIETLVFNPFQVNTYILYNESGKCIIVDPGCSDKDENVKLQRFLGDNNLTPARLINTHCHIDHIMGNRFVYETYGILPEFNEKEKKVFSSAGNLASYFNIEAPHSPEPVHYMVEDEIIKLDDSELKVIFTPGHSPGHIVLYSEKNNLIVCGDVLFLESIGRTDLPGGVHEQLINSILQKLYSLPEEVRVFPGHGSPTSIDHEKKFNPFVRG